MVVLNLIDWMISRSSQSGGCRRTPCFNPWIQLQASLLFQQYYCEKVVSYLTAAASLFRASARAILINSQPQNLWRQSMSIGKIPSYHENRNSVASMDVEWKSLNPSVL